MNGHTSNKVTGSMGLEERLIQTEEKRRYDEAGKNLLKHKEILALILKYSVSVYEKYTAEEIINFIDVDSITESESIAPDTDTRIAGDDTRQSSINEANLTFDVLFKVIEPDKDLLSKKNVHLHINVELQGEYRPGYPLEKRGIYNLARMTSSQLEVVTKNTNYDDLEKSYCIFICVGNVPKYLWNTVSYYEFANTKNLGEIEVLSQDYDLMELVIIRIGDRTVEGVAEIIKFLHAVFYGENEIEEYIDFSKNEQFRKELKNMGIMGEHLIHLGEERQLERVKAAEEEMQKAKHEAQEAKHQAQEAKNEAENDRKLRLETEERMTDMEKQLQLLKEQLAQLKEK